MLDWGTATRRAALARACCTSVFVASLALILLLAPVAHAQRLTVSAASSLTEVMEEIARAFEATSPGVRIDLNVAGSSTLAAQILNGAPFDVFASADVTQMQRLVDAGLVRGTADVFAYNELVVLATTESGVEAVRDLANPGLLVVLAAPDVPAGAYARDALADLASQLGSGFRDAVLANVVSEEPNVRQVAAKVALGEADAAIVYVTDAALFRDLVTFPLLAPGDLRPSYPAAVLTTGAHPERAAEFVAFLRGEEARARLAERGFQLP